MQGAETLCRCYFWRPRAESRLPHGDVHLLCGLLCGLPVFLRQHFRSLDHHHIPGARGQSHVWVQLGEEWGTQNESHTLVAGSMVVSLCDCDGSVCLLRAHIVFRVINPLENFYPKWEQGQHICLTVSPSTWTLIRTDCFSSLFCYVFLIRSFIFLCFTLPITTCPLQTVFSSALGELAFYQEDH